MRSAFEINNISCHECIICGMEWQFLCSHFVYLSCAEADCWNALLKLETFADNNIC